MGALILTAAVAALAAGAPAQSPGGEGPYYSISGLVQPTSGTIPNGLEVVVYTAEGDSVVARSSGVGPDGRFLAHGLAPGTYVVEAGPPRTPDGRASGVERGVALVTVTGADVRDLVVATQPGTSIRGRVEFRGAGAPMKAVSLTVQGWLALTEWEGPGESTPVRDDGTFVLRDLVGPRIIRMHGAGPDDGSQWWFESVQWHGRDVTNEPVDFSREPEGELLIVFALRPTAIVGSVEDVAGIPMTGACVVMLPRNHDLHHGWSTAVGTTTTDRRGRFYFTGMPPGEYRIEGLGRACPGRTSLLSDADLYMRHATAVTVGAGRVARIIVTGETSDVFP